MSRLVVEDLRVEYLTAKGRVRVVDGVSFEVGPGEIFGLAGESGSGKSTIALAVLRLLKQPAAITGGRIVVGGRDVTAMSEDELRRFRWREVSLVTQSAMSALNPVIPIGEQIADAIEAHESVARKPALARAAELLSLVGIDPARTKSFAHELSGGMRQRVVIAMALALQPPLVIMDEPTTALDVIVQREILSQIAKLQAQLGFSILFITHDLSLMISLCTHIGVLYAGRLAEVAPAAKLTTPRHPYTQGLVTCFPALHGPRTELVGIAGAPPDPRYPAPGCAFEPRCTQRLAICGTCAPALVRIEKHHEVACHRC
ncbi:MAG TPA: ABC transporter ATP-binding protein [Kofleriaceae bacterium]|nr:ABC transporter ATP-binding protein [Kofleriaceae bacterium]